MSHIIAKAIIENGQLKYVDKKLPRGRIEAHIIYDAIEKRAIAKNNIVHILKETSGIYKYINPDIESRNLRNNWERSDER